MIPAKDLLGKRLDELFVKFGLRPYQVRYEGQKDFAIEPILIVPTPHVSDLGVARLERPGFSSTDRRTRREADFYNIRQYSVKFSREVLLEIASSVGFPLSVLLSRDARYGLQKPDEEEWIPLRPLSEPVEVFSSARFISIILQPVQGVY